MTKPRSERRAFQAEGAASERMLEGLNGGPEQLAHEQRGWWEVLRLEGLVGQTVQGLVGQRMM